MKETVLLGGIWIISPVWGLRPCRAARSLVVKVPNPVMVNLSPLTSSCLMVSKISSKTFFANCLEIFWEVESWEIRDSLVIVILSDSP